MILPWWRRHPCAQTPRRQKRLPSLSEKCWHQPTCNICCQRAQKSVANLCLGRRVKWSWFSFMSRVPYCVCCAVVIRNRSLRCIQSTEHLFTKPVQLNLRESQWRTMWKKLPERYIRREASWRWHNASRLMWLSGLYVHVSWHPLWICRKFPLYLLYIPSSFTWPGFLSFSMTSS